MTSSFFSVEMKWLPQNQDCHLNSKYMHMIGDLYLKVASERKQKTEKIVGSM